MLCNQRSTQFLFGATPYNEHLQQVALALHEAGALGAYYSCGVDHFQAPWARGLRRIVEISAPAVDRQLRLRRITVIPDGLVHGDWSWELVRSIASKLRLDCRLQDTVWERAELRLDRRCAHLLEQESYEAFHGVEHGALASLQTARRLGKRTAITFASPHHTFRRHWVDREYERFPELLTKSGRELLRRAAARDARRDREAEIADLIVASSSVTARSLEHVGFSAAKIATIPLGAPAALEPRDMPLHLPERQRFVYAGSVAIGKGVHYLLDAWERLKPGRHAELHLYGSLALPDRYLRRFSSTVTFHGLVPGAELYQAFRHASLLVFPTLYDGFGQVVTQALAAGLPVLTTTNAGAADRLNDGVNGFVVPPADAQALVDKLDWCLSHRAELLAMRHHALAAARAWTWTDFRAAFRHELSCHLGLFLSVPASDDLILASAHARQ